MGTKLTRALPTSEKGVKSLFHYTSDNEIVLEEEHDVTAILAANKYQESEESMHHKSEVFNHVARIDTLAIKNWMAERGLTYRWMEAFYQDPKFLKDFLNDPDNKKWRTRRGKI